MAEIQLSGEYHSDCNTLIERIERLESMLLAGSECLKAAAKSGADRDEIARLADELGNNSSTVVNAFKAEVIRKATRANRVAFNEGGEQWLCRVADLEAYAEAGETPYDFSRAPSDATHWTPETPTRMELWWKRRDDGRWMTKTPSVTDGWLTVQEGPYDEGCIVWERPREAGQ